MPDEDALAVVEAAPEVAEDIVGEWAAGDDVGEAEGFEDGEDAVGRGQVGLGQAEQRVQARVVGGDQAAVDEAEPGGRVGQGADDDHLVSVGDDDPLDRVGVVGGTAQHGGALADPDDPGQGALRAGGVAGQGNPVADDDASAAQFPRLHGGDLPAAGQTPVAAPVDRRDERLGGIFVGGAAACPRPRATARPDPYVVLVQAG